MVENVTQINGVITVDVRVKNMYVEKIIFRILLNVVVKIKVLWMIQQLP